MRAVRQARAHLELDWLPLLAPPRASDGDAHAGRRRAAAIRRRSTPRSRRLGGAGTAELLLELGARDDPTRPLVRDRLVDASSSRRAAARRTSPTTSSPPSSTDLDRADRNAGRRPVVPAQRRPSGHGVPRRRDTGDRPTTSWRRRSTTRSTAARCGRHAPGSARRRRSSSTRSTGEPGDSPDLRPGGDPMMAVLDAARRRRRRRPGGVHRRAGRPLPARRRDYWMDGMRRVAEAAAAARRLEPLVASAFVNHVGSRAASGVGMYDIDPVRDAAATDPRPPHRRPSSTPSSCPRTLDRPVAGRSCRSWTRSRRPCASTGALFDAAALDLVTALAVGSVGRDGHAAGRRRRPPAPAGRGRRRADRRRRDRRHRPLPPRGARRRRPPRGAHRRPRRSPRRGDGPVARRGRQVLDRRRLERTRHARPWTVSTSMLDPAVEALADDFAGHEADGGTLTPRATPTPPPTG